MIRLTIPPIAKKEIQAVQNVLKSGYLIQGKNVVAFEKRVARLVSARYAVAVSSGTAGLHLALLAAGIGDGDEVIVPDFTYPATANVVELCHAKTVLADIDLKTLNLDANQLKRKITKKTRAVIPVHLFGLPAPMRSIMQFARKHHLLVIEDASCCLGAKVQRRFCGAIGHMGVFSFHPRKLITTGEGGMVVTNDRRLAEKLRALRNQGIRQAGGKTDFVAAGLNYRMTDFQAAIGLQQMKKLKKIITDRRRVAKRYAQLLKNAAWLDIPEQAGHVFQSYVVRVQGSRRQRDALIRHLHKRGIEATIGTYALHQLTYYKGRRPAGSWPQSKTAYQTTVTLPIYFGMKEPDIQRVCRCLKEFR